jgi:hypothetical protein
VGEFSVYYCAVHSGRRFRLRLDVKDWQDSRDVLEAVGGGGAREGLYVPDSGSFECRRDHFERSAMNRDVAWNPTIGAACDLFGHRGTKSPLLLRPLRGGNVVVAEAGFVRVAAPIVARGGKGGTD